MICVLMSITVIVGREAVINLWIELCKPRVRRSRGSVTARLEQWQREHTSQDHRAFLRSVQSFHRPGEC
jgi:hypothetical protein